jgi:hypothetical protein
MAFEYIKQSLLKFRRGHEQRGGAVPGFHRGGRGRGGGPGSYQQPRGGPGGQQQRGISGGR